MTHVETERLVATAIFDPGSVVGAKGDRTLTQWQVEAVMTALRSQQAPAGIRVKGLEWEATGSSDWVADSVAGQYVLNRDELSAGGCYNLWVPGADDDDFAIFIDKSEAKAAAEADYRQRILSALEPQQEEAVAITPHMLNAGTEQIAIPSYDADDRKDLAAKVFRAMILARNSAHPAPVQKVQESQPLTSPPDAGGGERWDGQCSACGGREKADIQKADGSPDGRVRCVGCKSVFLAPSPSPKGEEPVAWQNGEKEIALRWIASLAAKLGSSPDHANDVLWLQRLHDLLAHKQEEVREALSASHREGE